MPEKTREFISNNWKWIITVLIGSGILYNQFQQMYNDVDTMKRRQQTYIERFNDQKDLIHDLEIRIAVLENHRK